MPYYLCPSCARILKTNRCDLCRPASVYALHEMDYLRRQRDELAEALRQINGVIGPVSRCAAATGCEWEMNEAARIACLALANLEADE